MNYRGLVFTGSRARLSIDGVKVALAMNCTYGEEIQHDPIEPLDTFSVAEHVPISHRVNFTAQMVRVILSAIKNRDGVVIFPRVQDILSRGEMTATIEDPTTGTILANVQRVRAARYTQNISRAIVLTDCEFVAIRIQDESELG